MVGSRAVGAGQSSLRQRFAAVADARWFQRLVTAVILFAGVLAGVETYPDVVAEYGLYLHILDWAVMVLFIIEIVIKIGAEGRTWWRYFWDPWNVFDFTIVALCLLPLPGFFMALRLARVLRVLRLVRALPRLQILVVALLKSIPALGYVGLLLFLLFYVYAVTGTILFGANDPLHFGTLGVSLLSMFTVVTLEGWNSLLYIQIRGCANVPEYDGFAHLCTNSEAMPITAAAFFISFVLIGTMVILNLFVGVIINGMEEAETEQRTKKQLEAQAAGSKRTVRQEFDNIARELGELTSAINHLRMRVVDLGEDPRADDDTQA